jgi:hypothetical protein
MAYGTAIDATGDGSDRPAPLCSAGRMQDRDRPVGNLPVMRPEPE